MFVWALVNNNMHSSNNTGTANIYTNMHWTLCRICVCVLDVQASSDDDFLKIFSTLSTFPNLVISLTKLATLILTVFFCNGKYVFSFCVQKQKSIVNITLFWHFCIKIVPIWIQRLCLWYCLPNYVYISLFVWKYFKMIISGCSWSNS